MEDLSLNSAFQMKINDLKIKKKFFFKVQLLKNCMFLFFCIQFSFLSCEFWTNDSISGSSSCYHFQLCKHEDVKMC